MLEGLAHHLVGAGIEMPVQLLDDVLEGVDAVIGLVVVERVVVVQVKPGQRRVDIHQ